VQEMLQRTAPSVRAQTYLVERMFPRLRDRFGAALDTVVEFSTLGEYRLGAPAPAPASARPSASERVVPDSGWEARSARAGRDAGTGSAHRTVAGGAAALHGNASRRALLGAPAATPAASRRRRPGAPQPAEQVCLAQKAARA
jgi:hypothetical protein